MIGEDFMFMIPNNVRIKAENPQKTVVLREKTVGMRSMIYYCTSRCIITAHNLIKQDRS